MDKLRDHIERLLEERQPGRSDGSVRARLAADFSEGVEQPGKSAAATDDVARAAAFIDGRLSGSEREAFLAELARDPARRADLESAAALVEAADKVAPVPAELLAWAQQLGESPAAAVSQDAARAGLWERIRAFEFLPSLSRRNRPVWAGVAALLLVAVVGSGVRMPEQAPTSEPPPPSDTQFRSIDRSRPQGAPPPTSQPQAPAGGTTAARPQAAPSEARSAPPAPTAPVPPSPQMRAERSDQLATAPAVIQPGAALGAAFRLTDQNGSPVSDQDLKGRPSLIFFGSINSAEASTTTLAELSE